MALALSHLFSSWLVLLHCPFYIPVLHTNAKLFKVFNASISNVPSDMPESADEVNFQYNRIKRIDECAFCMMPNLTLADFTRNKIETIHPGAFNGTQLGELILQDNKLTSFPNLDVVGSTLTSLSLLENNISVVDNTSFDALKVLTKLTMSQNSLGKFLNFSAVGDTLETLYLEANKMGNVTSEDLMYFQSLSEFSFMSDEIGYFPDFSLMPAAANLKKLVLSTVGIMEVTLEDLQLFKNLTSLHLNGNQLQYVPPLGNLSMASTLLELNLYQNKILFIANDTFAGLSQLSILNLATNLLANFPLEATLPISSTLTTLAMGYNQINMTSPSLFIDWLSKMSSLNYLKLEHNQLESFPDIYHRIPNTNLTELYLYGNPFTCDCLLAWIKDVDGFTVKMGDLACVEPAELASRNWEGILKMELCKCPVDYYYRERKYKLNKNGMSLDPVGREFIARHNNARSKHDCAVQCATNQYCWTYSYHHGSHHCAQTALWLAGGDYVDSVSTDDAQIYSVEECPPTMVFCESVNVTMDCEGCTGVYTMETNLLYQRPVYVLTSPDDEISRTLRMDHSSCLWAVFHPLGYALSMSENNRYCDPYQVQIFSDAEIICSYP